MGTRNVPGAPKSVTSVRRTGDHLQRSRARGLELVGHVGMPQVDLRERRCVWPARSVGVDDCGRGNKMRVLR